MVALPFCPKYKQGLTPSIILYTGSALEPLLRICSIPWEVYIVLTFTIIVQRVFFSIGDMHVYCTYLVYLIVH